MIVAVSTVKDTAANVERFVARNLGHGVDHLVVFTEQTGADAEAVLDAHPAVTHVPTGRGWWGADRSDDLNVRQRQAANLARVALAPFGWAEWLVHVDGDEVALLDRDVVAGLPDDVRTFKLEPLEAVSRATWPGEVTHYKRLLDDGELNLLTVLGLIGEPSNKAYFHGHVRGKRGVRLRTDVRIGLHTVKAGNGRFLKGHTDPGLRMLHLDAATVEEFIRKWSTLAGSGSRAVYRKTWIPVVRALRTLSTMDLPDETRERYLRRLYDLTTAEDLETLDDLGLLEHVDPDAGTHRPETPPSDDLGALAALLDAAAGCDHESLTLDHPAGGYDVLQTLLERTGVPAGPAERVMRTVARTAGTDGSAPRRAAGRRLGARRQQAP
ncbi:hypothetical protein GCM10023340_27230 [Nocardioides marinquilinus]|uniref:Glycosyltransferase family 2 protein n=1 Tax=Nocardioides marinquilinus TaxID=1210400 RepID=A0ABP9PQ30_9ACTN